MNHPPSLLRSKPFAIVAVDSASLLPREILEVHAISADEARRTARAELATRKRDDWSIVSVRAIGWVGFTSKFFELG